MVRAHRYSIYMWECNVLTIQLMNEFLGGGDIMNSINVSFAKFIAAFLESHSLILFLLNALSSWTRSSLLNQILFCCLSWREISTVNIHHIQYKITVPSAYTQSGDPCPGPNIMMCVYVYVMWSRPKYRFLVYASLSEWMMMMMVHNDRIAISNIHKMQNRDARNKHHDRGTMSQLTYVKSTCTCTQSHTHKHKHRPTQFSC